MIRNLAEGEIKKGVYFSIDTIIQNYNKLSPPSHGSLHLLA